ncbi:MAG: hypothetical protein HYX29_04090 [Solirubrobacterales bacterium]|nr:hypothetical protein [Solirubrobacterales bacterium]
MTRTSRIALLTLTTLVAACIFSVALFAQTANANVTTTLDARYQQNGTTTEIPNPVAGSHPDFRQTLNIGGTDDLQRLVLDFPPGLIGDPNAIAAASRCTVNYTGVTSSSGSPSYAGCPASSRVGTIRAVAESGLTCSDITLTGSIYLLQNRPTANPEVPAYLGINLSGSANVWLLFCAGLTANMNMTARITLRPTDQGLRVEIIDDLPKTDPIIGGDIRIRQIDETISGMAPSGKPFLTAPTRCGASSSWDTNVFTRAYSSNTNTNASIDGTAYLSASSSRTGTCTAAAAPAHTFSLTQTNTRPGAPVGLRAVLNNPVPTTNVNQAPYAKSFSLVLPVGMKVNPAIGARLGGPGGGCTEAQFLRADANNPVTAATPTCPTTSEVGNVAVTVPEITGDLSGRIYLGEPRAGDAAAGIYRLYINAARGGVVTKFQGTATVNASNGQVTVAVDNVNTYFTGLPQFNYSRFDMDFNSNSAGIGSPSSGAVTNPQDGQQMLVNPQWCGVHTASATVVPWTSPTQSNETFPTSLTTAAEAGAPCAFNTFNTTNVTFSARMTNPGTGSGGTLNARAGQHSDLTLNVARADRTDNLKNLVFKLPVGYAGSANAVPTCSGITSSSLGTCTNANALGSAAVTVGNGPTTIAMSSTIYNVVTDNSSQTAKLAIVTPANVGPFSLGNVINYSILTLDNATSFRLVSTTDLTQSILGVPIDYRNIALTLNGMAGATPFLTNPSETCGQPLVFDAAITAAGNPNGASGTPTTPGPAITPANSTPQSLDCTTSVQPFTPGLAVTPTTLATAQPTGLTLTVSQSQTAATTQQSTIKDVTVTMPTGLEINPGFAASATACPTGTITADIAAKTNTCAGTATKIADVTVNTPLLATAVTGQMYLEQPGGTPTTRYRFVLYISMPGGMMIVRGGATLNGSSAGGVSGSTGAVNSGTGQLVATFTGLPDVPWSSMALNFNSTTPMFVNSDTIGTQTFTGSFAPYSTSSSNPATATASYLTNYNGTVGSIGADPWAPTFSQTISSTAPNAHPDLSMTVNRSEKSQQLSSITYALPSGLTGAPAAVPTCSQVQADAAACPASTRIGSLTTSVGSALVATPGVGLASLSGNLYNTAAAGALAKFTAIVPVVLGPFNLGSMTLPVAVSMRPATDPDPYGLNASVSLPNRYEGVKIRYRSLAVTINGVAPGNGANFLTNPSQCATSKTTTATMTSNLANVATGTQSFTTGACAGGFGATPPTISVASNPAPVAAQAPMGITANVANATGNPTVKRINITMPAGVTLNAAVGNSGANTTCSTANIDADTCGSATVYGTATMTTPLIAGSFVGNIYLETPTTTGNPDERFRVAIIVPLPGQKLIIRGKIRVNGDTTVTAGGTGSVDTGTGVVTADFDNLPDLSFNTFNVNFNTGSRAVMIAPSPCSSTNTITGQLYPYNNPATNVSNNSNLNNNSPCVAATFNPTFSASVSSTTAGANPDLTMAVTNSGANVDALRSATFRMPTGFVANTNNVARCTQAVATAGNCATPAVGTATIVVGTNSEGYSMSGSIYNVTPNANEPARLQAIIPINIGPFVLGKFSAPVSTSLRSDYGIDATASLPLRYEGVEVRVRSLSVTLSGTVGGQPFAQNPSVCSTVSTFNADLGNGSTTVNRVSPSITINGCPRAFGTAPTLAVTPSTTQAADPVGLTFNIGSAASNPTMKRVQIDFPTGMEINPAFANGLTPCTAPTVAGCAAANSIGTVSLTTPLLSTSPLSGNVYVVTPGTTAGTRYKVVMIVDLPGTNELIVQGAVTVNGSTTIPTGGTGAVDSGTGKIYADFDNIPDLGFTAMALTFNSGTRAMVVNPETNGTQTFTGTFTNNAGGANVTASPTYATTGASTAFNPSFTATASSYVANAHPTLTMNIGRADKSKQLRNLAIRLPAGLTANTAAVPQCTQASAAAATCATTQATSQVGTIPSVTIGSGTETYNVTGGKIFAVVPNATEPVRFQAIIPVVVGPYNLGNMTVPINGSLRGSDYGIDLATTLPTRYEGIAVRIQTMQMVINGTVNAADYMNNPSKCTAGSISADMTAADSTPDSSTANNSSVYTATGCPVAFGTAPTTTVSGISTSTQTPTGMVVSVNSATGNPSIGGVRLTLPAGMSLNPAVGNNGANTTCATAVIDAITPSTDACPAASQQGTVSLTTPLLAGTFTGKVYLESPGTTAATRYKLAIVVALPGQMLIVHGSATVDGSTTIPTGGTGAKDSGTGVIVADFPSIPDLAFNNLTLTLATSNRSMLITPSTCQAGWSIGTQITPNGGGAAVNGTQNFTTSVNCTQSFAPTFSGTLSSYVAGANPNLTIAVTNGGSTVNSIRNFNVKLPTGLVANTTAVARCPQASATAGTCASTTPSSAVGTITTTMGGSSEQLSLGGTVYNVVPNATEPARLAALIPVLVGPFNLGNLPVDISTALNDGSADSTRTYAVDTFSQLPTKYEGIDVRVRSLSLTVNGTVGGQPFMINPSACISSTIGADIISPDPITVSRTTAANFTGCNRAYTTDPTLTVTPSTQAAGQPVGLQFDLGTSLTNPTTKNIRINFPTGFELNPAAGSGLNYCSAANLATTPGQTTCDGNGSRLGTVTLTTPLLSAPQTGAVYLEQPGTSATTRYKAAIVVKLPSKDLILYGAITLNGSSTIPTGGTGAVDSGTGQIVADFPGIPDLGFTNMRVAFNSGSNALFVNPEACTLATFSADWTPTGTGAVRNVTNGYTPDTNCAAQPFAPTFNGSASPTTSAANPDLTLNFVRPDNNRDLRNIAISLPTGLVAATSATSLCSQATAAAGGCAANQIVGTVSTSIGSGASTYTLNGSIYNVAANASEAARFSAMIPVVVGPFDLGKLTIPVPATLRSDLGVDATAQLPTRYEGIAVRIRSMQMVLNDTANGNPFMINPSKCQSNSVGASMTSDGGSPATVASSFSYTTTGCTGFTTAPSLTVATSNSVPAEPAGLTFTINSAANNPTMKRVQLTFPSGMEINPAFGTGLTACPTATINAGGAGCLASATLANVTMVTPLLNSNPTGKVYLESPGTTATTRYRVAMVIDLPGQKLIVRGAITINGSSTIPTGGTGSVDSGTGQISADFDNIPDLGFTSLTMAFNSGNNAMVVNPETCANSFGATFTPNSNTGATTNTSPSYPLSGCGAFGFDPSFTASVDNTAPAGHPNLTLNVARSDKQKTLKSMAIHLPTGLVANTSAVATPCTQASAAAATCATTAAGSQVGSFTTSFGSGASTFSLGGGQIFQVTPSSTEPVRFAAIVPVVVGPFDLGKLTIPVTSSIRADYGIDVNATMPQRYEGIAVRLRTLAMTLNSTVGGNNYMTNPSKCQSNTISAEFTAGDNSVDTSSANNSSSFTTAGCSATVPAYNPTLSTSVNPTTAGAPTALTLGVAVPTDSATTNRVQVALPVGMELNPGVGNGLVACSTIDTDASPTNPCKLTSSNIATVTLNTPLLPGAQTGEVYLETPGNTASTRYKLALVIHLPGRDVVIKGGTLVNGSTTIAPGGLGSTDPTSTATGQVTADFPGIPDLGFTNMSIAFNSASKLFVNPKNAATQTVQGTLTPNSDATTRSASATFSTSGGTSAITGWNPTFSAALSTSVSGSNSNLTLNLGNPLGMQELKSFGVTLPVGLVANTAAVPRCSQADADAGTCAAANAVGTVSTTFGSSNILAEDFTVSGTIYNVIPNADQPARLQAVIPVQVGPFVLGQLSVPVPTALNPDLTVTASASLPSRYEGIAVRVRSMQMTIQGQPSGNKFLVAPSKCGSSNISGTLTSDTNNSSTLSSAINITGCPSNFTTGPTISVSNTTNTTAAPTGMTLQIDSAASNPTIGSVVTTMPLGMTLNPAVANLNGAISACPTATINALASNPNAPACPAASKVGDVSLVTPLLPGTKTGAIYLEEPGNTAATRYKLVMIVDLPGTKLIVRGSTTVNGSSDLVGGLGATDGGSPTGRIVASFNSIPDLGFTQLMIAFSGGANALFTNSETAGTQTVAAQIAPQSGGSTITANGTYSTVYGGSGSQASEPFNPTFGATFSTLDAAANPDVTITVNRADYTQQIEDFDLHLPPGLVANTVLTPRCSQADAAAGTCAAASAVGSVTTRIGTGSDQLTMNGTLYNVIPDAAEPARLAVVIAVQVGPYNLGKLSLPVTTQIVTGAQASDLSIDTHTALPKFYEGVPVRIRELQILLEGMADQGTPSTTDDKPFMINPSQCASNTLRTTMTSTLGNAVTIGSPGGDFTIANCANAPYNPAITASLSTTERGKPVGIDLGFQFSGNSSSTKKIVTTFPAGMAINPGVGNYGVGMTCAVATVQAGGVGCPSSSRLGAVSLDTPLLPTTQTGALYLLPPVGNQAATRYRLGLFVDLPGAGDLYTTGSVTVDGSSDVPTGGTGAVDSGDGQVIATFDNLPDLQFNNLTISFKTTGAGEHALFTNPNTCGTFNVVADMSPWARPTTSEQASTSFTTTDTVASCIQTESADQPGYVSAELGAIGPDFNNPAGPAYYAGASQPVTMTVNRPDSDKSIKRVKFLLPPGLVGSADAAPTCTQASADAGDCATTQAGSQIGTVTLKIGDSSDTYEITGGLFNTDAPSNRPAKFTFIADVNVGPFAFGKVIVPVDVNLDNNDYSLFAETGDMPQVFEGIPVRISQMKIALVGTADQGTPSTADDKVFMSNPRSCSTTLNVRAVITSSPGNTTKNATAPLAGPFTNCSSLNLNANTVTIENQPVAPETGNGAERPTGLNVQVHQDENLATQATLKELELALPGFRLSAPAANGLQACTASQLNNQTCPPESRVGTAWLDTSLLPKNQTSPDGPGTHSLWGAVYLETPGTASDGSDRYKLAIQLTGKTLITIRGIARVNETTGEITTKFEGLPDIPFTDFRVELTGYKKTVASVTTYFPLLLNPEGVVGSPSTVQASANLTPHSGTAPVTRSSTLSIDAALAKTFTPTTTSDISPLTSGGHPTAEFNISRGDGQQDIKNVAMQLPAGFLGSAAAVPLCPLGSASAGTCNDQSKVGDVVAEIGQYGQKLTLPGKVYLTEGVGGDIAGMSIKVPAKAGPYDLGDFITQGRIQIRPSDHGITVNFVDVPKMFKGVPTHIQNMDITLPGIAQSTQKPFLYNASDCSPFSIVTSLTPYTGAVATDSDSYQATGCPARAFNPSISFAATSAGDDRTAPSWTIKMRTDTGDSTLKSTTVVLPSVMTVNVAGISDACPADLVASRSCPATSKIGTVTVDTPLLSTPVTGTVYMAKSISGQSLPDLLVDIPAPIDMQIRGANSFVTGAGASQIKSTFNNLPDLVWSELTMTISGGPKGILGLRSDGKCAPAASSFASHSGQAANQDSPVTGLTAFCQRLIAVCANPVVKVSTKGAKRRGNKKVSTALSLTTASNCQEIKSVRVSYPKGTKINKKLIKWKKTKNKKQAKAYAKNLKNLTGKAGTKKLTAKDFAVSGSNGLKFKAAFPANSRTLTINTKSSALVPSYKTFCGHVTKKKYKKKYKTALKKCQKKNVTYTFEITNVDGTAYRYNYVAPAGSKFFK